jgi:hypothetical protein
MTTTADLDTLTWVDPTGLEFPLEVLAGGPSGRFGPSISRSDGKIPGRPGVRRIQVLDADADVSVPILVEDQGNGLRTELRTLVRALDPNRGPGYLRSECPEDGSTRIFRSRYDSGLSFDEPYSPDCQLMMLVFAAEDEPYWEDETDTIEAFTAASTTETVNWFGRNWFPFTLSASAVNATIGLTNPGDVDAWPVITVAGPGSELVVSNPDTGDELALTGDGFTLGVNESVTIDTRPRRKTVTHSSGASLFAALSAASQFFSLPPGASRLSVRMASATVASQVTVAYRPRYRSA